MLFFGQQSTPRFLGFAAIVLGAWIAVTNLLACRRPRVARANQYLLMYLRGSRPIQVPLEIVEVFFRGQSPLDVQARSSQHSGRVELESVNVVVRLAERAIEWQQHEVSPTIAKWCGGYVSLLGTQCEPITPELLSQLNARLVQAHRELRDVSLQGNLEQAARLLRPGAK